LKLNTVKIM